MIGLGEPSKLLCSLRMGPKLLVRGLEFFMGWGWGQDSRAALC